MGAFQIARRATSQATSSRRPRDASALRADVGWVDCQTWMASPIHMRRADAGWMAPPSAPSPPAGVRRASWSGHPGGPGRNDRQARHRQGHILQVIRWVGERRSTGPAWSIRAKVGAGGRGQPRVYVARESPGSRRPPIISAVLGSACRASLRASASGNLGPSRLLTKAYAPIGVKVRRHARNPIAAGGNSGSSRRQAPRRLATPSPPPGIETASHSAGDVRELLGDPRARNAQVRTFHRQSRLARHPNDVQRE